MHVCAVAQPKALGDKSIADEQPNSLHLLSSYGSSKQYKTCIASKKSKDETKACAGQKPMAEMNQETPCWGHWTMEGTTSEPSTQNSSLRLYIATALSEALMCLSSILLTDVQRTAMEILQWVHGC